MSSTSPPSASTSITALCFSPCGGLLAFLTSTSHLRIWTGSTLLPPLALPPSSQISFGPSLLAVASSTAALVRFIHPPTASLLPFTARVSAPATVLTLSPPHSGPDPAPIQGRFAALEEHIRAIRIVSYAGTDLAALPPAPAPIFAAAFSSDGALLALGDTKGAVRVWRFAPPGVDPTSACEQKPVCSVVARAHTGFVSALAFSPVGDALATAGWDGLAVLWKLPAGRGSAAPRKVATVRAEDRRGTKAHAVALAAEHGLLATAGASGIVRVWRTVGGGSANNEPVAVHGAHAKAVYKLAFAPDGRHVASGSADGTVRVLGVPGKPVLISKRPRGPDGTALSGDGEYEIRQMEVVLKGQRADRRLIFCPSAVITLACPICTAAYDAEARKPICSGVCGHTFACGVCNDRLWDADAHPTCPECRAELVDVVPNYELLRVLSAAREGAAGRSEDLRRTPREEFGDDYVDLKRLSWLEVPELAYMRRRSCAVYSGSLDGEAVAIRLPTEDAKGNAADASGARGKSETERHLRCLKRLRGPHVVQLYGVSRTAASDGRIVVVSELPGGGTLAGNLDLLRGRKQALPPDAVLALALQLCRAVRFLHEEETSAGWALVPEGIALALPFSRDWSVRHKVKLMELGGTLGKVECYSDLRREFPAEFVGYMAPELLDEDLSVVAGREESFRRLCRSDMYALGVLLWEIASGNRPFEGKRPAQVVAAVVGRNERPGFPPSGVAEQLQNLITRLWAKVPEHRPSATQACEMLETVPSAPPMF